MQSLLVEKFVLRGVLTNRIEKPVLIVDSRFKNTVCVNKALVLDAMDLAITS